MARLIDADNLFWNLQAISNSIDRQREKLGEILQSIVDTIENAQTVDPVKGRWKVTQGYLVCSRCASAFTKRDSEGDEMVYFYCPACGAKMDQEDGK